VLLADDIRRARAVDIDAATDRIAEASHPLAVSAWLVAEPLHRARVLHDVARVYVQHAVARGSVWITGAPEPAGVAVWLPWAAAPVPGIIDYDRRLAVTAGPHLARFQALDHALDLHHPDEPHDYLAFLAVAPVRQRGGIGSALLAWHHRLLDGTGTPAYLEASSSAARRLCLRHGYRDRYPPIDLPDGPRLWPMWRAAS
jgi:GNAT superfamily N-acetyltransferase